MKKGFTLIEILVSLIILSIGVLGFLALDRSSLHWLTQTATLEQENQIISGTNELIEGHDGLNDIAAPCPACTVFSALNPEWLVWKDTFPKYLSATLTQDSNTTLKLSLCEDEQCTDTVFQV